MTSPSQARTTPAVGLSVMPQPEYLAATLPLFEDGVVDTIEWSFDMSWRPGLPEWLAGLIHDYGTAGKLSGHGVSLSALSMHPRQDKWFERFAHDVANHQFSHVSEHFGFMAAGDFRLGPPLPLPLTTETLRVGRRHLKRLAACTQGRVGLENLAFAFGVDDVWTQGDFLESLLAPVDGFLVLDVHNLWCQIVNFDLDAAELLASYPVERVRECHISGGTWSTASVAGIERTIRRDTHNDRVPDDVFALLETVLGVCPNVETVILEQIGDAFVGTDAGQAFRDDYRRVRAVVSAPRSTAPTTGQPATVDRSATSDPSFPAELMAILDSAPSVDDAIMSLRQLDGLVDRTWTSWVDQMDPHMVSTAIDLVATWGRRDGMS